MIKVVTFEREYGCGAADIARKLSDSLGFKLWDQALTDEIARRMDCSSQAVEEREERRDPFSHRLFKFHAREFRRESERPAARDGGRRSYPGTPEAARIASG